MTRRRRICSSTDVYHVTVRGVGLQNIFVDDDDRLHLFSLIKSSLSGAPGSLYAWCFMSNHIHLVLKMPLPRLSTFMQGVLTQYARMFNKRHGRCGHLFQERFFSDPIEDEPRLLSAIRYVHQNPQRANVCSTDKFEWSSYPEYIEAPVITSTEMPLSLFEGIEGFIQYHCEYPEKENWRDFNTGLRVPDDEIRLRIEEELGEPVFKEVLAASPERRDRLIREMMEYCSSQRQLQRLTGLGCRVIGRALGSDQG